MKRLPPARCPDCVPYARLSTLEFTVNQDTTTECSARTRRHTGHGVLSEAEIRLSVCGMAQAGPDCLGHAVGQGPDAAVHEGDRDASLVR